MEGVCSLTEASSGYGLRIVPYKGVEFPSCNLAISSLFFWDFFKKWIKCVYPEMRHVNEGCSAE